MSQPTSSREFLGLWQLAKLWKPSSLQERFHIHPDAEESDADSEEEVELGLHEDSVAEGEDVILGIEMLREHQKWETIARVWPSE